MSGGCGLSQSVGRRAHDTIIVLLNFIVFFGFGLASQGIVLGAEDMAAPLLLSTGTEVSEEAGGSQGAVPRIEPAQGISGASRQAGAADSPGIPGVSEPIVPLANSELLTMPAIVLPAGAGVNESPRDEKTGTNLAGPVTDVAAGHILSVSGVVQATDKSGDVRTLRKGDAVNEGDTISTAKNSSVKIAMSDDGSIDMRSETLLKFDNFKFNGNEDGTERSFISLFQGGFRAVTGRIGTTNKQNYRVFTPIANIGVLGTDFDVVYLLEDRPGATAGVYDKVNAGATILTTDVGSIRVGTNQMGYASGLYKLPQIQPVILGLFTDNPLSSSDAMAGSPSPAGDIFPAPATPSPPSVDVSAKSATDQPAGASAVAPANVIAANGEAQKNGEVKYEAAKRGAAEVRSLRGFKYALAPIVWGGDISETLTKSFNANGANRLQNMQRANVRARSYIWQPWLAQVGGGIGLVRSKDSDSSSLPSGYTTLVGHGSLSVLPSSRYPFSASFRVDDSRANYALTPIMGSVYRSVDIRQSYRPISNTSISMATYARYTFGTRYLNNSPAGNDTTNTHWTLRHDYSPLNSTSRYGIGYDRNVWNTVEGGGNASWGLQGNYSTSFDKQSFGIDAHRTESFYALNGADYASSGATMRHGYRPDARLSVTSSASIDQSNMSANKSYNTRYLQANTASSWQPDQDLPLYVNASARIYDSSFERDGVLNTSQNQVVSAGARYAHTRNLSYALDGSVANSKTNGLSNRTIAENGSVNYTADPTKFGNASYNRNANGSVNFQSNTASPSNRTLTGGVGHGLGIPYYLDSGASLNFGINESFLARNDRINGQNRTLSHAGNMSWQPVSRGTLTGGVNANVSDIRNVGGDEELHYQAASLGANVQDQISANSSMRANASLQWTANKLLGSYSNSANANMDYRHARAFDVKGLRYELKFNVNKQVSRSQDATLTPYNTSSASLDQHLDYGIGRTNLRLSLGLARYGNDTSKSIMLHLGRRFGNL